jgi:hypothetical protein
MMKSDRSFLFLVVTVVLSRIPLLFGGFGADGDAWRIAKTALALWNEGTYHVSRFPGFPVYEILQTPIIALGGSFASNSSSLILFLFSVVVFRKLICEWNIPHPDLLLISYTFLPILWKNSAVTMDYVWGMAGILASFRYVMQKKVVVAGIILGLAAGTRISHIVFLLPFFFVFKNDEKKQWLILSLSAVFTAIVCYLPVIRSEDYLSLAKDFLNDAGGYSPVKRIGVIAYRIVFSIGVLGCVSIAAVLVMSRRRFPVIFHSTVTIASAAVCVTGIILFAILPDEREYLIPIFPFFLILLSHIADRKQFTVITAALLSYGIFSIDVIEHSIAHPKFDLKIQRGYLVKEYSDRNEIGKKRSRLSRTAIPDSSFVMIGMGPMFWLDNPLVKEDRIKEKEFRHDCARLLSGKEVLFIYALYKPQLDDLRRRGYTIYYWDEMKEYLQSFIGYSLPDEAIRPVNTSR